MIVKTPSFILLNYLQAWGIEKQVFGFKLFESILAGEAIIASACNYVGLESRSLDVRTSSWCRLVQPFKYCLSAFSLVGRTHRICDALIN